MSLGPAPSPSSSSGPTHPEDLEPLPRLRVLLIEDDADDAALLVRELRRAYDLECLCVDTSDATRTALDERAWDLVISDYSLRGFDAPTALAMVRERGLDVPFIIVSATIGEEAAVASLRAGARDFVLKNQRARLLPAIARELAEAQMHAEQRRLREQLLASDRMASLGTLAAGVAHEINNPLAAMVGNTDLVATELEELLRAATVRSLVLDDPNGWAQWISERMSSVQEMLADIRDATGRVHHVARDLKVFSRGDDEPPRAVDLTRVLESTLRLAHNQLRHRARVVRDYAVVPAVWGNEARLGQVFLNLVVNAAQALPEGCAEQHSVTVTTRTAEPGFVAVELHDTGPGIPPQLLGRIFDPFFTTKPVDEGTGLGLAICHRIVVEMNGTITVASDTAGTRFTVLLPIAETNVARPANDPRETPPQTVHARVLVIDDEPLVGKALARLLRGRHEVTLATSARETIATIAAGEAYDVIACDLLMPEMTGMQLFEELSERAPAQARRVVFITGGAFTPGSQAFLERVQQPVLEKPFDARKVLRVIEEVATQGREEPRES